jgi:hypothetical protein
MRIAMRLGLLIALLWAGGWFVAARMLERAAETWFAEAASEGLRAGYAHLAVAGFPAGLALRLEAPQVVDPLTGLGWAAEGAEAALALTAPRTLRLRPEGAQSVWLDLLRLDIAAGALTADIALQGLPPGPGALTVSAADLRLEGVPLMTAGPGAAGGWTLGVAALDGQVGLAGTAPALRLTAEGITLAEAQDWPETLAPRPEAPLRLTLEAAADYAAPVEAGGRLTAARIEALRLDWGTSALTADGRLEVGADGLPEGRILLVAENWRPLLGLAVVAGWVAPELAPTWLRVLETLEAAGSDSARAAGVLEVPVVFRGGLVSLGPLPLGRAPLLAPPLPPAG